MHVFTILLFQFQKIGPIIINLLFQSHNLFQIQSFLPELDIFHLRVNLLTEIVLQTSLIIAHLQHNTKQPIKIFFPKHIDLLNSIGHVL